MIHSVSTGREKSIHHVSDLRRSGPYAGRMGEETDKTPGKWGTRFRALAKAKGWDLAKIAEAMERSESGVRSWTNGSRDINLAEFLQMCKVVGLDPAVVLFTGAVDDEFLLVGEAWAAATAMQRGAFVTVAKGVLAERDSAKGTAAGPAVPPRAGPRRRSS